MGDNSVIWRDRIGYIHTFLIGDVSYNLILATNLEINSHKNIIFNHE